MKTFALSVSLLRKGSFTKIRKGLNDQEGSPYSTKKLFTWSSCCLHPRQMKIGWHYKWPKTYSLQFLEFCITFITLNLANLGCNFNVPLRKWQIKWDFCFFKRIIFLVPPRFEYLVLPIKIHCDIIFLISAPIFCWFQGQAANDSCWTVFLQLEYYRRFVFVVLPEINKVKNKHKWVNQGEV